MSRTVVRISEKNHNILREIATEENISMQAILERAIELYRRHRFLTEVNKAYAALRRDETAWADMAAEYSEWSATVADGLPAEEHWDEEGNVIRNNRHKK